MKIVYIFHLVLSVILVLSFVGLVVLSVRDIKRAQPGVEQKRARKYYSLLICGALVLVIIEVKTTRLLGVYSK